MDDVFNLTDIRKPPMKNGLRVLTGCLLVNAVLSAEEYEAEFGGVQKLKLITFEDGDEEGTDPCL
jgi:hypothetical protein